MELLEQTETMTGQTVTTPFYATNVTYEDNTDTNQNRDAFQITLITLYILACVVNILVIAVFIYVYVRRREIWNHVSVKSLPVLMYCLVLIILHGVLPFSYRLKLIGDNPVFTCGEGVARNLAGVMLFAEAALLVAAVILIEVLLWQKCVTLTFFVQMMLAIVLLGLSVLYTFIVVLPVFYFAYLEDHQQPCIENYHYIRTVSPFEKPGHFRALSAVVFIIPHFIIFCSCGLLLLAHVTRTIRHRSSAPPKPFSPVSGNQGGRGEGSGSAVPPQLVPPAEAVHNPDRHHESVALMPQPSSTSDPAAEPGTTPHTDDKFPFNVLLAAVVSFVFYYPTFHYMFFTITSREVTEKEHQVSLVLQIIPAILLPCCWLLDCHLRTVWCCCRSCERGGGSSGVIVAQTGVNEQRTEASEV